jgi:uncharacterized protein
MDIKDYFQKNRKVALAFSGGTDSAYLLHEAVDSGADVRPYFIKSPFQPDFELNDAIKLAKQFKSDLQIIEYDILQVPEVSSNNSRRCYYCKKALFSLLKETAAAEGYDLVIDGTNASDNPDNRPGMQALNEMGIQSPLRICGLTKDEIRARSRAAGLFTWDKPAYACLATRVPTDMEIDNEKLRKVELAEQILFDNGFEDFRIRLFHDAARIQLHEQDMRLLLKLRQDLNRRLYELFPVLLLDLTTREEKS